MNRGLNWAYFMFNNRYWKYFRYVQMTSFISETIIEFSVFAQLVLRNRILTSTYITLIWMLLWDPLTYLFHWGTRVLVSLIILIKSLTTTAHDRRASGDCGTSGCSSGMNITISIVPSVKLWRDRSNFNVRDVTSDRPWKIAEVKFQFGNLRNCNVASHYIW